jgi:hypothetical protein
MKDMVGREVEYFIDVSSGAIAFWHFQEEKDGMFKGKVDEKNHVDVVGKIGMRNLRCVWKRKLHSLQLVVLPLLPLVVLLLLPRVVLRLLSMVPLPVLCGFVLMSIQKKVILWSWRWISMLSHFG